MYVWKLGSAIARRNAGRSENQANTMDPIESYSTVYNSSKNIKTWIINIISNYFSLGERINDESSIYFWAAKNKIPVFSPALTDGSLGDMLYFHSYRNPGLIVDIISDLRRLNTIAVKANNSGIIIVGSGLVKHHICNANLMVKPCIMHYNENFF